MQSKGPSAPELPQRLATDPDKSLGGEPSCILTTTSAARTMANIIRPCYGPCGRQKFLVAANGDMMCTGHAAAILRVLKLEHPAAQLVREAVQTQAENSGDGSAFVILLTEALLEQAENLLRAGLSCRQLRDAFATATAEVLSSLPSLAIRSLGPLEDPSWALHTVMDTHTLSSVHYLTSLVAHMCWSSREPDGSFKPERVGVCTLLGGTLTDSCVLPGLVMSGKFCGQNTSVLTGARVALFACPFGPAQPSTAVTARLSSPEDLTAFKKVSDPLMEREVAQLATAEINVVVVWGDVHEKALVEADKQGIIVIQVSSRKEIAYLSEVLSTMAQSRVLPPMEPGRCQKVYKHELGDRSVVVFEWEQVSTPAFTLILRGATADSLRDTEQAIFHGINAYFQLCQDPRLLPGAGAAEMALARILADKGSRLAGPEGLVYLAFAEALRSLPKALAENAGLAAHKVMALLTGIHQMGNFFIGVGMDGVFNVAQEGVWDLLKTKAQGLQVVADVVQQLLRVDRIIVAKNAPVRPQSLGPDPQETKRHPPLRKKFFGTCP
uniref:T-complex protein 1 subunit theta-like 2 n=1 Tax=Jaculus jaculus TaxID=51337 RepID=UPI001E1B4648|nr:T-complex protein 1 subunit theta-like 2 [Jaculus jaculus]